MGQVRRASGLIAWVLRKTGFAGVTLPWAIYILPERWWDEKLHRHEQAHWEQMKTLGVLKFYALYLWYTLRYGYRQNPLEVQAREASNERPKD